MDGDVDPGRLHDLTNAVEDALRGGRGHRRRAMTTVTTTSVSAADLAVDRELARVSDSFRFLLDLTPVDVESNRHAFLHGTATRAVLHRELEDDPEVLRTVLSAVDVADVEDRTLGHLLRAGTGSSS